MENIFKTATVFTLLIVALSSCQPQVEVKTMLENEATRDEINKAIISNQEYSRELMEAMMEDDHTQMMIKSNGDMMNMMMSDNTQLMSMMKENPEMIHGMMSNLINMADADSSMCASMIIMMKDKPNMMGQMMDMMNKEGIMVK